MTGTEFQTYVLNKFIRTDKSTQLFEAATDTIALMRITFNPETYKEEASLSGISTLGDFKLGIPVDFGQIIGQMSMVETVADQEYDQLIKISKIEYDELYRDRLVTSASNKNTGVPRHFCVYGEQFHIGPVPDKTTYKYFINYTTEDSDDVTTATTSVPFTEELRYRNILRNGTLFELHDGLENFPEAANYKALYLDGMDKLETQEARNTSSNGMHVVYSGY